MCTTIKIHVKFAFQVSPGMEVTWSPLWGDRSICDVFLSCATTPRLCLYFGFWTSFMSQLWI